MPEQIQKPVQRKGHEMTDAEAQELAEADTEKQAEIRAKGEETISDIDALLDEIDGLLEEQAEEFVRSYQQKGGE